MTQTGLALKWLCHCEDVLSMTVIPGESWVCHFEPKSQASMQWQYSVSPLTEMYKVPPSEAEVMPPFLGSPFLGCSHHTAWTLPGKKKKVNQSHYRPGVTQRVPGS